MTHPVEVVQADRDAAAGFVRHAWHLFWPNDYNQAMRDASDYEQGRIDNWFLVQAFARHRLAVTPPPVDQVQGESLADAMAQALSWAFEAGATSVHSYWSNGGELPCGDPEFGKAASDYVEAALDPLSSAARVPAAVIEALSATCKPAMSGSLNRATIVSTIFRNTGCSQSCAEAAADALLAMEALDATQPARLDRGEESAWLVEENAGGGIIHWIALERDSWPRTKVRRLREPMLRRLDDEDDIEIEDYQTPVRRVKDANEALRFARKEDAEAFIALFDRFILCPVATEHQWPALTPSLTLDDIGKGEEV